MPQFDYFAVIAGMRTGSNLLEEKLNAYRDLTCHGELFNPHFVGRPGRDAAFGIDMATRDADPAAMIAAMRAGTEGLAGFRIFDDHDPRALRTCLDDARCAKIVLTRAPLDSYVSLKIARKTGQWWLGDVTAAKPGMARFDADEFEAFLSGLGAFLSGVRSRLQTSGQTAYGLRYDDLGNDAVIAGLARFLGAGDLGERRKWGRVQNPGSLREKVENFDDMAAALGARDPFDLDRRPSFELDRGPRVRRYLAAKNAPLLYLPLDGVDDRQVTGWLAALGGGGVESGLSQRDLRRWLRGRPGHRKFTVLHHPLVRAHHVFCRDILPRQAPAHRDVRRVLSNRYGVPLPQDAEDQAAYDVAAHRKAFLGFLMFLKANLDGQTTLPTPPQWATQTALLAGMARIVLPDAVLRGDRLDEGLARLGHDVGVQAPLDVGAPEEPGPYALDAVHDDEIEAAARTAYRRDYIQFGFEDYRPRG